MLRAMTDALKAARHAQHRLELGQTRDAAWLALYALDLDARCGLALTVLARIILEVNEDPLGTLATRRALTLDMPEAERPAVERFHRIDLWTRGLLAHGERAAMLPVTAFDDAAAFEETPRFAPWLAEQLAAWGDEAGAQLALTRMAGALADAMSVPETEENPLRADAGWQQTPLYQQWKAQAPLDSLGEPPIPVDDAAKGKEITVLSDYWIEQEIAGLGASGNFELALERAELWARLRPHKVRPKCALVRLLDASGNQSERDRILDEMVAMDVHDLNELEEARLTLGERSLWEPQIRILDRMDRIAPGHPVILANRGAALLEIGETARAAQDLEQALQVDPTNAPALATLGLVRMREDEYVAARELLERAKEAAPDKAQVRVYLAACKNNQGSRQAAIEELEEALRLEPDNAQAKQLLEELQSLS